MTTREDGDGVPRDDGERRLTGRMVLFGMLAFFGVVFFANGVMMWMAARTFDGLDEPDAYRRGIHYNERLHEAQAQRRLGWRFAVSTAPLAPAGPHEAVRLVRVEARDRTGAPLAGLAVRGIFRSPVNAHEDRVLALAPDPRTPGRYRGDARLPRAGKWQFVLEAEDAAGHRWRGIFDLYLEPVGGAPSSGEEKRR